MTRGIMEDSEKRYYRHGEAFWRDLIARQAQSGQGVRKFCQANGVGSGTFHKLRDPWQECRVGCTSTCDDTGCDVHCNCT